MDNISQKASKLSAKSETIADTANDLIHEGIKFASDFYGERKEKINTAQQTAKEYTDELATKVKKNPLTSVLIAAGVGFLISSMLKK
ncbi:MAG: hypothetical protein ACOVQX_00650 [Legionella sp.]